MNAKIYSVEGKEAGSIALPEAVFGVAWNPDMVHEVVTGMQANARAGTAHTKDRSEVRGGGKKPWKQKGTGQARHGSIRSPLWRHGGVTFGPRNERNYSEKINRKMRIGALLSVLSRKAKDGEVILIDSFSFTTPKTTVAKTMLAKIAEGSGATALATKKKNATLLALSAYNANTIKSFHNFKNVKTEELRNLNLVDVMTYTYLVIEKPKEAFATLLARVSASRRTK